MDFFYGYSRVKIEAWLLDSLYFMNKYHYELTALGLAWCYIIKHCHIAKLSCDTFHNIEQLKKKMDCCNGSKATRIDIWPGDNENELAEVTTD